MLAPFPHPKTLLLDLDGTLLGMRPGRTQFRFALGVIRAWSPELSAWTSLRAIRSVGRAMRTLDPDPARTCADRAVDAFARVTGLGREEAAHRLMGSSEKVFRTLQPHFFPLPGAQDFVRWASQHFSLVLATDPVWLREIIEHRVRWAGLDPAVFKFISHAGIMRACKPHPEYFQQVLDLNGLLARDCWMIGNEERMDLPARQVGLPVFLVGKDLKPQAGVRTGSFAALRKLLETPA